MNKKDRTNSNLEICASIGNAKNQLLEKEHKSNYAKTMIAINLIKELEEHFPIVGKVMSEDDAPWFIFDAMNDFFSNYDVEYFNGDEEYFGCLLKKVRVINRKGEYRLSCIEILFPETEIKFIPYTHDIFQDWAYPITETEQTFFPDFKINHSFRVRNYDNHRLK